MIIVRSLPRWEIDTVTTDLQRNMFVASYMPGVG
eukprot:SAG31_NODE_15620_length_746_cov_1.030912_1_plen_33_part_10